MAKQNFLAGGYYGKLGQTVGQRWKNIRTIRSYVIPHNPRTEAQQANRGRFGDCVFFAQVANQLNYKAPCFNNPNFTDWNYRMKTARALQDLGLEELERFPLYPVDFSVPYTITEAVITKQIDATHIEIDVSGTLPEAERVLTLVLLSPGVEDWKKRLSVCLGVNSSDNYNKFTFTLPDRLVLTDGMQGRFISCDDVDSSSDLIASSTLEITVQTKDIHTFDTTITSAVRSGNNFTLTFAEPYNNGTNTVTISNLKAVVNGAWENIANPSGTLINNGGFFALVLDCSATDNQDLWAFPVGAEITIASISSVSATVEATATNATEHFSNTDLSRTYKNTISSITRSGTTFTAAFTRSLPAFASQSGTLALRCVSKGAWVTPTIDSFTLSSANISFSQSAANQESIYAFPSGATITANHTLVSNGVTYTAETTTAQSVANTTDLTRTISSAPKVESELNGYSLKWVLDGDITISTAKVAGSRTFSQYLGVNSESGAFTVKNINSNEIAIDLCSLTAGKMLALVGSKLTTTAVARGVANGVTYQIPIGSYNYDTSGISCVAYCDDTYTIMDNSVALYFNTRGKPASSISAVAITSSGYIGTIEADGSWLVRGRISGSPSFVYYGNDIEITINTTDITRIEDGTDANVSPDPLQFKITQGGKSFTVAVWNKGANIDNQIGD